MIKKWLYLFYSLSLSVLVAYLVMIFLYSKENRDYVTNVSSVFLENSLIKNKIEKLKIIKQILENEYDFLIKHLRDYQINLIKKEVSTLEKFLESISNINNRNFLIYVNNLFTKYKFPFKVMILNENYIVISSNDFSAIGKKLNLKCDPFENIDVCEIKKDFYYYVKYMPNIKSFIVVEKKLDKPKKDYFKPLIITLKSFPGIIVYNIKGEMDNKHFYYFEEFKPLKIFYGIGISYEKLESFPKNFTKKTSEFLFHHYLKLTFFMSLVMVIYMIISTFLLLKIRNIGMHMEKEVLFDKLTNLLNRKGLEKHFDKKKTLLIIDLDNFKYINDTFGHQKGDEILIYFSNLLKEFFRGDVVSRWGGDEFIILTDKSKEDIKKLIKILNEKIKKLQNIFDTKKTKILSISCGGSMGEKEKEEKFKEADLALYKVKKTTKMGCKFYDELDYVKIENF